MKPYEDVCGYSVLLHALAPIGIFQGVCYSFARKAPEGIMGILEILGLIFAIILAIFIPRTIVAVLLGILFGGGFWWILFAPLTVAGLLIDCFAIE